MLLLVMCWSGLSSAQNRSRGTDLKLWYNTPARAWEEALPLGNGKTGAMIFGGVKTERIQLNDNTLWSGYPLSGNNADGPAILPQVREAVFKGDYQKASSLWKKMQGPYSARYLPLGDLILNFHLKDSAANSYYRDLDLNQAVTSTRFKAGGINYSRESFISHPDKVMVLKLTSDKKGALNFTASLSSKLRFKTAALQGDYLVLRGKAPKYVANRDYESTQVVYDEQPRGEGMTFEIHLRIKTEGGSCSAAGDSLKVRGASTVTLYLTEATSFNGFDKSPGFEGKNPAIEARSNMEQALRKSYDQIKRTHIADYASLFNRVQFNLSEGKSNFPIDERLRNFKASNGDPGLQVLYYQFGRYLMIASSRQGSRPTNLQGIWNDEVQPPWGSNYTMNINTEMNYWLAENANLSELHQPLFDFMKELAVNGARTAKINYNINEGWAAHHNADLWAKTSPTGGYDWDPKGMPRWSAWPMAGAWLSTHLWEHYLFSGNTDFLKKEAYPLMKGSAEFMLHWLINDPSSSYLVTNPSTSPENTVKIAGKEYQLSMASTMDMAIIRELFTACIQASSLLEVDEAFRGKLEVAEAKLYPYQIGQYGQLQEWYKDWDDPKDTHRHISHLFGLFPGNQISVYTSPQLAAAAKQSLLHRGDISTGWSMAWKMNWWARLKDGNHAYKILESAFTYIDPLEKREQMSGGGTYPNMFDAHPPFQIDGNFGGTAGITEMLLQSHEGEIHLLPALPDVWRRGYIKGIRARGNFQVDITWDDNELQRAVIISQAGGNCRVRTQVPVVVRDVSSKSGEGENPNPLIYETEKQTFKNATQAVLPELDLKKTYVIDFHTTAGKRYVIEPIRTSKIKR